MPDGVGGVAFGRRPQRGQRRDPVRGQHRTGVGNPEFAVLKSDPNAGQRRRPPWPRRPRWRRAPPAPGRRSRRPQALPRRWRPPETVRVRPPRRPAPPGEDRPCRTDLAARPTRSGWSVARVGLIGRRPGDIDRRTVTRAVSDRRSVRPTQCRPGPCRPPGPLFIHRRRFRLVDDHLGHHTSSATTSSSVATGCSSTATAASRSATGSSPASTATGGDDDVMRQHRMSRSGRAGGAPRESARRQRSRYWRRSAVRRSPSANVPRSRTHHRPPGRPPARYSLAHAPSAMPSNPASGVKKPQVRQVAGAA